MTEQISHRCFKKNGYVVGVWLVENGSFLFVSLNTVLVCAAYVPIYKNIIVRYYGKIC